MVDSAVASDKRGPGFELSHWQLLWNYYLPNKSVCRKYENEDKEACGQSYNGSTIVNYNSRGIPD